MIVNYAKQINLEAILCYLNHKKYVFINAIWQNYNKN